jgi:hypothetical protein
MNAQILPGSVVLQAQTVTIRVEVPPAKLSLNRREP